jgi:hypothetical protein
MPLTIDGIRSRVKNFFMTSDGETIRLLIGYEVLELVGIEDLTMRSTKLVCRQA